MGKRVDNPFRPPSDSSDRDPKELGVRPAWWWATACVTFGIGLYCAMSMAFHAWLTVAPSDGAERHQVLAHVFMGATFAAGLATVGSVVLAIRAHLARKRVKKGRRR